MATPVAIAMTGRGGQGSKLAMELLAWSASAAGLVPVLYSVYGALIRGGDVASSLVVATEDPGVALCDSFDLMCAMHDNWFERYYSKLCPGGILVADEAHLGTELFERSDVRHVRAPLSALASGAGDRRASNMVAAGIVASLSGTSAREDLRLGMSDVVPPHRSERIEANLAAVEAGFSWAEALT